MLTMALATGSAVFPLNMIFLLKAATGLAEAHLEGRRRCSNIPSKSVRIIFRERACTSSGNYLKRAFSVFRFNRKAYGRAAHPCHRARRQGVSPNMLLN